MKETGHTITSLLEGWRRGNDEAFNELLPLVYSELRRLAARGRSAPDDDTLRPTALVHEAYLRFQEQGGSYEDRTHFYAAAALAMRRLMIDYVRAHRRRKRGGDAVRVELAEQVVDKVADTMGPSTDILALDRALERLGTLDERKARILQLRFFAGLSYDETAEVMGLSPATVGRELRFAKAWLARELAPGTGSAASSEPGR